MTHNDPGVQLGYAFMKSSMLDAGVNYYRSINPNTKKGQGLLAYTFGPFASADLYFINGITYAGERGGIHFHYLNITSLQVNAAIEHIHAKDWRAGSDIGLSFFGIMLYYGYYFPIGNNTMPGVSPGRFGVRLIFNCAPIYTTPFE